ncbi:MAG: hypothetical protein GY803_24425 [Chloroflexi bacterium]|nr:hypothetical protein [Chloroflexota bacterium]
MARRLKFECYNIDCGREYSLLREVEGQPKLMVECPFCGAEAEVDLAPYRSPAVNIQRGDSGEQSLGEFLNLPDVLPTTPRKE